MKYTVEEIMAALKDIRLVDPSDITMVSDGYGEFPDSYKFTDEGIEDLTEEIKEKLS